MKYFEWCECVAVCLATRSSPFVKIIQFSRVSENRESTTTSLLLGKFAIFENLCVYNVNFMRIGTNLFNALLTNNTGQQRKKRSSNNNLFCFYKFYCIRLWSPFLLELDSFCKKLF